MADEFGEAIPLWAQRLLLNLQVSCAELEPRIADTKASTASKLVSFKSLKEKKEQEQEQAILAETVKVNNEIMKRREQVTADSGQFHDLVEGKLAETRELEKVLHAKSSLLPKMSETLIKLQSELEGLKKQEESLNQSFKKAKAMVSEEAKKVTLADPAWADLDLLEPIFQTPEVPLPMFTSIRADQAAPKRDPVLARPSSSMEPRKEISTTSQQRFTRAGRAEVVRLLLSERSKAIVETIMLPHRFTLHAIIETLQKEDPLDPIDPESKILIARGIQNLHTYYGKDIELVEWLIKFEIGRANDPKNVFPHGSTTHFILSTFALRYGSSYLKDTIRDLIFRILKDDKPFELNPDKIVKNVEWVDLNIKAVKSLAYDILIEIVGSCFKIPMQLRKIVIFLKTEMVRKFPQEGFNMIARLLFDGLFCRAIENPEESCIDIKDVPDKMRPLLRTLAGIMSRVSKNEPFTEDIHLPLNEFISNYIGLARKFLNDTLKPADREVWGSITPYSFASSIGDIEESLKKLSLNHIVSLSKRISDLDAQRLYSSKISYLYQERLKIIQDYTIGDTLSTMEKTHPFADDVFDVLFDEDGALIDSIAAVATPKSNFDPQPLATAIITCSLYKDPTGSHAEFLIRNMLRKEMSAFSNASSTPQAQSRLLNSFGACMYAAFARVLGGDLLQELIPPLLENVRKGKCGKLDKKGCGVLATFVESIGLALHRAPLPMWKLASFLTRQLMDPGPSLFLVKYIGQALENPSKYMTKAPTEGKEKDKFQKQLASIRLFFIRVATTEPLVKLESKYFSEANSIIKEVHDSWVSINDTWSAKDPNANASGVSAATAPTIIYTWEDARAAIKQWMEFVDADSSFELLLAKPISTNVAFTLGDLFFGWALPIGARASTINVGASK
jgi:hypothetical protein